MRFAKSLIRVADSAGGVSFGASRPTGRLYLTGSDFLCSAQGIATDGRYYYCTGTFVPLRYNGLTKIDIKTGCVVLKRERYLPEELKKQGFNHYGGCTCFEGKLYVAIEDKDRAHPCIGVFRTDTLEFTGEYRILGADIQPNGNLPWCAADRENQLLYTGFFDGCDRINKFDIDTLELLEKIPLSRTVEKTQGGEMYGGLIYISCHDSWRKKHIYSIDPATGRVLTVMERLTGANIVESEGMTILPLPDGSFFHQLDVIYPLGVAIRRYSAPKGVVIE